VSEQVALFPLGTVLFPGQLLPLHVFEPRYRRLVAELLTEDDQRGERGFGVLAIRIGRETGVDGVHALHPVGTFAMLRAVTAHEDGRFDVVTQGTRRFRLRGLDQQSHPYAVGDVEWLDERPGGRADPLAATVARLHGEYRTSIGAAEVDDLPSEPGALSYRVATTTVLTLADQQALLEAPDDSARLRAEVALLRRELALWRRFSSLPDVDAGRAPVALN
jgi:Lon protease-like protein